MRMTLSIVLSLMWLVGCGGGGGGGGGVCSVARSGSARIAGGSSCSEGSEGVALVIATDPAGNLLGQCTGSYISLTAILTAAHCFPRGTAGVVIGSKGNLRDGSALHIHPRYDGSVNSPFDLAIVKVAEPLNGSIIPLLLSRIPVDGDRVIAYGYGTDESGDNLLDRVANGDAILKATDMIYGGFSNGTEIVVSNGHGNICPGDSGGPVLAKNNDGGYGIFGVNRAIIGGCSAVAGKPSALSSTQTEGALDFISTHVPDAAVN